MNHGPHALRAVLRRLEAEHAALVAERDRLRDAMTECRRLVGIMDAWNDTRDEINRVIDTALKGGAA